MDTNVNIPADALVADISVYAASPRTVVEITRDRERALRMINLMTSEQYIYYGRRSFFFDRYWRGELSGELSTTQQNCVDWYEGILKMIADDRATVATLDVELAQWWHAQGMMIVG